VYKKNFRRPVGFFHCGILLIALFSTSLSSNVISAQSSCEVPPSSDWLTKNPEDYLVVSIVDFGEIFGQNDDLEPLTRGLSTEWSDGTWSSFPDVAVENDSATGISMILVPGYQYTFCIEFSSEDNAIASEPEGDVYLLTGENYDIYSSEYEFRGLDFDMDFIPVEWRDMSTWITFRDSHSYESASYVEFSVGIDSSGSAWSSLGLQDSQYQEFHLVLDGWDNSRVGDEGAAGGKMNVEIMVEVEKRNGLPNYTAYVLIAILPLSCVIIPIILHSRYMSSAIEQGSTDVVEVPFIKGD